MQSQSATRAVSYESYIYSIFRFFKTHRITKALIFKEFTLIVYIHFREPLKNHENILQLWRGDSCFLPENTSLLGLCWLPHLQLPNGINSIILYVSAQLHINIKYIQHFSSLQNVKQDCSLVNKRAKGLTITRINCWEGGRQKRSYLHARDLISPVSSPPTRMPEDESWMLAGFQVYMELNHFICLTGVS